MKSRLVVGCFALLCFAASCSTTKAYQREFLADPLMEPDGAEPVRDALRAHFLGTREGAVGGFGGAGGGCGCN